MAATFAGKPLVLLALLTAAGGGARAQSGELPAPSSAAPAAALAPAVEAAGAAKRAWTITPRVMLQETFTDNVNVGIGGVKSRDEITEVAPGIRIIGNTARAKVNLDYSVRELFYARNSKGRETQQALNATAKLEAIEKFLFLDLNGIISQQAISPFGVQSANYAINDNRTETSNYRFSPYVKGRLGSVAEYEGRYSRSWAHSKASQVGDTDVAEWRGIVKNDKKARIGWEVEASQQRYDYSRGRRTEAESWRGLANVGIADDWRVAASLGHERNDFISLDKQGWQTHGFGVEWRPNQRTSMAAFREKRFFGTGHTVSINHRLQRSALKYEDSRNVAALPNRFNSPGFGTIYDLLFTQLASAIPDEALRADFLSKFLQQNGLVPTTPVISGFLDSQVTARRSQELSYVLRGARNTVTVAFQRTLDERLGVGLAGSSPDPLLAAGIAQRGVSLALSHQLSAVSTLNVNGSHSRSTGSSVIGNQATQKSLTAGVNTRLSPRTTAGVAARRTTFDNQTAPYSENALVGTLTVQF